jgi:hypothetical protein
MAHSDIRLALVIKVINLGQKVADRLIQTQISLINGNTDKG